MTELTELGVAAIRNGVASGEFSAVEVAEIPFSMDMTRTP